MGDFSNQIKIERTRLDFTQDELAQVLGVSVQTICKWEKDIRTCPALKLLELRNVFGGCSLDYIVGITEERVKK